MGELEYIAAYNHMMGEVRGLDPEPPEDPSAHTIAHLRTIAMRATAVVDELERMGVSAE
jgi:hypothetical protein